MNEKGRMDDEWGWALYIRWKILLIVRKVEKKLNSKLLKKIQIKAGIDETENDCERT